MTKTEIIFTNNSSSISSLCSSYSKKVLITDSSVHSSLDKEIISLENSFSDSLITCVIPSGESHKSLQTAQHCWEKMAHFGIDRQSCVIGVGGGMVTDLAGFVAACYMRGIDLILAPTTLLSMVDASYGGKTGINLGGGKNLIGSMHFSKFTLINPLFLNSLPDREYRSGLAEVIKYGVIRDPDLFSYIEKHHKEILRKKKEPLQKIIERSLEIKKEVIIEETETKGIRDILNWGHTFGHAIEAATHYQTYLHGEAIAIGMNLAAQMSVILGYANQDLCLRQNSLIKEVGLPLSLPSNLSVSHLIPFMLKDKKGINGKISLILAKEIGKVLRVDNIDPVFFRSLNHLDSVYG